MMIVTMSCFDQRPSWGSMSLGLTRKIFTGPYIMVPVLARVPFSEQSCLGIRQQVGLSQLQQKARLPEPQTPCCIPRLPQQTKTILAPRKQTSVAPALIPNHDPKRQTTLPGPHSLPTFWSDISHEITKHLKYTVHLNMISW